jgi:glycerol-3-phosphate O-acyltransferase
LASLNELNQLLSMLQAATRMAGLRTLPIADDIRSCVDLRYKALGPRSKYGQDLVNHLMMAMHKIEGAVADLKEAEGVAAKAIEDLMGL